ncbi:1-deoxy-D-xylulose-5-phosphate reductoisomerase [Gayadomonas joobiniege]|uniref:1-deoxy-D-xylulose-5-phosphate reductoisomerase n=1 Tax=Gayadomonas joobiniege TaxID=1234606 RepID=UPI000380F40A|nr:1-deoxy-D-xylulose-5-phosphate reductoisomerase [Gayadomonas joobiniege]
MKNLAIFGSTGSIGESTLAVVRQNQKILKVYALAANQNDKRLLAQCLEFKPAIAALVCPQAAARLEKSLKAANSNTQVVCGTDNLTLLAKSDGYCTLVAAIVGAAGLPSTFAAAQAGKKILLANKEALVMSGRLFIDTVKQNGAKLLPVDSEHNAIFQSLPAEYQNDYLNLDIRDFGIHSIILTGSGGPFLNQPLSSLASKTPEQACKHPNWSMGQKISVDSASMMNKGLELIEACWLFGVDTDFIEVLIHPQSVIHSMVRYIDGSVLSQMGAPDMKIPIAHCLGFSDRIASAADHYNFIDGCDFTFKRPDYQRFPNLKLAKQAFKAGQEATTVLSAVNEVHVGAFLQGRLKFTQIAEQNERILNSYSPSSVFSIDSLIHIDQHARSIAEGALS